MSTVKNIKTFKGNNFFLSNFYPCKVVYESVAYSSAEHAFQAAKSLNPEIRRNFTLINECAEAKRYGRMIKLRSDWETVKYQVMYDIVKDKFTRNAYLREKLIATDDMYIEEGNHHGDKCWGTVNGEGDNNLGKILMRIREELKNEIQVD